MYISKGLHRVDSLLLALFAGNRKAGKESQPLRLERTGRSPRAHTVIDRVLALGSHRFGFARRLQVPGSVNLFLLCERVKISLTNVNSQHSA